MSSLMSSFERHPLRTVAIATLVALGGALVSALLTIAFPHYGLPTHYSGLIYVPPQAYLVPLLFIASTVFAFLALAIGFLQNRHALLPHWTATFAILSLLLVCGPVYFTYACFEEVSNAYGTPVIPTPRQFGWQTSGWVALLIVSSLVILATALSALVYTFHVPAMAPSPQAATIPTKSSRGA